MRNRFFDFLLKNFKLKRKKNLIEHYALQGRFYNFVKENFFVLCIITKNKYKRFRVIRIVESGNTYRVVGQAK